MLFTGGEQTETSAGIELPLKLDWGWGVDIFIQAGDPTHGCFGCMGAESFELDPSLGYDRDTMLHIVWGGNSISNPVYY
jgi:hypothetical protein